MTAADSADHGHVPTPQAPAPGHDRASRRATLKSPPDVREENRPATNKGASKSLAFLKQASGVVRQQLDRHLMPLLTVPDGGGVYDRLGSGILLRRDGRAGVLTAAHVARPISELLVCPSGRIPVMLASTQKVRENALDGAVVRIRLKQKHQRLKS